MSSSSKSNGGGSYLNSGRRAVRSTAGGFGGDFLKNLPPLPSLKPAAESIGNNLDASKVGKQESTPVVDRDTRTNKSHNTDKEGSNPLPDNPDNRPSFK